MRQVHNSHIILILYSNADLWLFLVKLQSCGFCMCWKTRTYSLFVWERAIEL